MNMISKKTIYNQFILFKKNNVPLLYYNSVNNLNQINKF